MPAAMQTQRGRWMQRDGRLGGYTAVLYVPTAVGRPYTRGIRCAGSGTEVAG